jgi:hypothetical protein
MTKWFRKFMDEAPLTKHHVDHLKKDRGFSDLVISQMGFRSGGSHALQLDYLPEAYRTPLADNRVIIPYLSRDGDVTLIRPHKMGLKDMGVQVYVPWPLLKENLKGHVVLAESEFKAVASCMLGVPAIGIPGIATFSKKKYDEFKKILAQLDCNKITVCFDNEVKNNPSYSNYKPDYKKRYDTQFYAFIMAHKLQQDGFDAKVALLPSTWMVDGKVDIDGALSHGITEEQYQEVIEKSHKPLIYKKHWGVEQRHMSYIERRIARFLYTKPITTIDNNYYDNTKKKYKRLSNFTMRIPYTLHTESEDGVVRVCQFMSNYGNSTITKFTADDITSRSQFQKWAYHHGDYMFYGGQKELDAIINHMIIHQDGREVYAVRKSGYYEQLDGWIFDNCLIRKGEVIQADENGIYWIDETGYKLDKISADIPVASLNYEADMDVDEVVDRLGKVIGKNEAKMVLGWLVATAFMPAIIKKYHCFPFMFLYGKTGSGKTTIGRWLMNMLGFSYEGFNIQETTQTAMGRLLGFYSYMPCWFDEYRNEQAVVKKHGFLRSTYDRQGALKGVKSSYGLRSVEINASVFISGQELPHDAALNNRCVNIMINPYQRDETQQHWFESHSTELSNIFYQIVKNKDALQKQVLEKIDKYIDGFKKSQPSLDARVRLHYSIFSGGYSAFTGDEDSLTYNEWVAELVEEVDIEKESQNVIHTFYNDWQSMREKGDIKKSWWRVEDEKTFIFWPKGFYDAWEAIYSRRNKGTPSNYQILLKYIYNEPYFREKKPIRLKGSQFRCLVFDIDTMPSEIKDFIMVDKWGESDE